MSIIRYLSITHFRSISHLEFSPNPGLNCIIGPGDSGKSTILDAIDWVLGARKNLNVSDCDFYNNDLSKSIEICATISVPEHIMSIDKYGQFIQGFDLHKNEIHDEPQNGDIPVLTLQLIIDSDLEPVWKLFSVRSEISGTEGKMHFQDRVLLAPMKLGVGNKSQFTLSQYSVLSKLIDTKMNFSGELSSLHRVGMQQFRQFADVSILTPIIEGVNKVAQELGIPLTNVGFGIDADSGLSSSSIALQAQNNLPVRTNGTGSTRLLLAGLQHSTVETGALLLDEAEYGLEPYRISLLLKLLGSKSPDATKQSFITTHSPFVLRELTATQLVILRKQQDSNGHSFHGIKQPAGTSDEQGTLRACAEAFFAKKVIVCEGATEVGFLRAFDQAWSSITPQFKGLQNSGVYWTDGNGEGNMIKRADVFQALGYSTYLFKDSDITTKKHLARTAELQKIGVSVIEWGHGQSIEKAIVYGCPEHLIDSIVKLAIEMHSEQQIIENIISISDGALTQTTLPVIYTNQHREYVATAAGKYDWFKSISRGEELTEKIVLPFWNSFAPDFQTVVNNIWATASGH
jgi:putative ATP-dependent endonuclease of the OLD family